VIDVLAPDEAIQVAPELAAVYLSAFGAPGYDEEPERAEQFATEQIPLHSQRDDFKLVVSRTGEKITGFVYGFTGQRGQWWSDRVAAAVTPELAAEWIGDHFEVVDLAVAVEAQRQGVGRALMEALMSDLPNRKALLTTYTDDRPAPRLYRRLGWKLLVPDLGWGSALYGMDTGVPIGQ
jgi:ribosomal protein S18 acetylase RimI-like enzyme